jgi:superfamily I DNA and/or RNA helicase
MQHKLLFSLVYFFILINNAEKTFKKRSVTNSRYYLKRIIWDKRVLSYSIFGKIANKNQTTLKSIKRSMREAFFEWEKNSCFKFVDLTPSRLADIKIIFTNDQYSSNFLKTNDPLSINYTHQNCERRLKGRAGHAFFRFLI